MVCRTLKIKSNGVSTATLKPQASYLNIYIFNIYPAQLVHFIQTLFLLFRVKISTAFQSASHSVFQMFRLVFCKMTRSSILKDSYISYVFYKP